MGQVLVLNASYEPLNITSWRRATVLMLKGKAESLEEDDSHNIRQDIKAPTVIRLRQFIRIPYRDIPLSRKNVFQRDNNCCQYCYAYKMRPQVDSRRSLRNLHSCRCRRGTPRYCSRSHKQSSRTPTLSTSSCHGSEENRHNRRCQSRTPR